MSGESGRTDFKTEAVKCIFRCEQPVSIGFDRPCAGKSFRALVAGANDNVPSNVPRVALRISFESMPRIKRFPREMKKNLTGL